MTSDRDALGFRCSGCGHCCRALRVAVTAADVARLAAASGRRAPELVEWLGPDAVDMSGEPQSFVELSAGRRLMVLAQTGGACLLLDAQNRCGAYDARPLDCRAFPFDFGGEAPSTRRSLRLLPLDGCEYTRDGHTDFHSLQAVDHARWHELRAYQARVAEWNRLALRRRRFGHRAGSPEAFLEFALVSA